MSSTRSRQTYKKVVALNLAWATPISRWAAAYDRTINLQKQLLLFNSSEFNAPKCCRLQQSRRCIWKVGQIGREIAALQKASRSDDYSSARYNFGYDLLKTGRKQAAMKEYEALKNSMKVSQRPY